MVQTLAPDRADESLREGILPRAARGRENSTDSHALHTLPEGVTVDCVAVAQEVGRWGDPGRVARSDTSPPPHDGERTAPPLAGAPHRRGGRPQPHRPGSLAR